MWPVNTPFKFYNCIIMLMTNFILAGSRVGIIALIAFASSKSVPLYLTWNYGTQQWGCSYPQFLLCPACSSSATKRASSSYWAYSLAVTYWATASCICYSSTSIWAIALSRASRVPWLSILLKFLNVLSISISNGIRVLT